MTWLRRQKWKIRRDSFTQEKNQNIIENETSNLSPSFHPKNGFPSHGICFSINESPGVQEATVTEVHPNYPGSSLVPVCATFFQTMAEVAGVKGHQMNLIIGMLGSGEAWHDLKSLGDWSSQQYLRAVYVPHIRALSLLLLFWDTSTFVSL